MSHPYQSVATSGQAAHEYGQYFDATPNESRFDLAKSNTPDVNGSQKEFFTTEQHYVSAPANSRKPWYKRPLFLILCGLLLLAIVLGAVLGGVFGSKASNKSDDLTSHATINAAADGSWGGDGSTVTTEDGSTFTYNNSFGGFWVSTPLNFSAQCRSDVKPLSEQWDFSTDRINGVNLGGWFVLEPFINPDLFEPFANEEDAPKDEYTLSQRLGSNLSTVMEQHYRTFITEQDFAQIASAGLDWIRLPIPYWFIETQEGEPFLEGVGWQYVLKAFEWCRKYGLRMEFDIHALPGSQNGQNHSGFVGSINFLAGIMGIANAQRGLDYIRTFAQFISQPEYAPIVGIYAIANEMALLNIGESQTKQFYVQAYDIIRGITGIGEGKGPMIAIHDGFVTGNTTWPGFMHGADRLALEPHYYLAFSPDLYITNLAQDLSRPCQWWAGGVNASLGDFGFTFGGEWCLATTDCGQWINGMNTGSHFGGNFNSTPTTPVGDCGQYVNWRTFSDDFKTQMRQLTQMYMDFSRNNFFWSWKMAANSSGEVPNPLWSYQLGWQNGWIPADPREAAGACERIPAQLNIPGPANSVVWNPPLDAWMTGGSGAGSIAASATAPYTQWPPTSLTNLPDATNLYTYTRTGTPITLSVSLPTGATATANGWANPSDTAAYYTPISGCSYPPAYSGASLSSPTAPPCPSS